MFPLFQTPSTVAFRWDVHRSILVLGNFLTRCSSSDVSILSSWTMVLIFILLKWPLSLVPVISLPVVVSLSTLDILLEVGNQYSGYFTLRAAGLHMS